MRDVPERQLVHPGDDDHSACANACPGRRQYCGSVQQ
jgi:hypothetical protein